MDLEENNKKNLILWKSVELFGQKGYEGVGIAEICEATNLSKPTIYYYFQSKQGLFEAVLKEYGSLMYEKINNSFSEQTDFITSLTSLLKAQIEFAKQKPDFYKLYMNLDCKAYDSDMNVFQSLSCLRKEISSIYFNLFCRSSETFGNMRGSEDFYSKIFKSIVESTTKEILNNHIDSSDNTINKIVKTFVYGCAN